MEAADETRLKMRIKFPVRKIKAGLQGLGFSPAPDNEPEQDEPDGDQETRSASLGHVLTNAIVLQEFVLEVTAIMQIRASMFGEVVFV
jgi:hypothetical protein